MSEPIVTFDDAFKSQVGELVRKTVEEAIVEMCLAGVSACCIEDVSEILWGASVSPGSVSNLNEKSFKSIDEWCCLRWPASLKVLQASTPHEVPLAFR